MGMFGRPLTWLSLSLAAAVLLLAVLGVRMLSPRLAATAGATPASTGLRADIVIPPQSLAAPDFTLHDQDGKPVSVSAQRGQVLAITFLDSHCTQLCPLEADQLAQAQKMLGPASKLSLLVVSVAPATDTPDSERAFAAEHHWIGDWHWLMGTPDQLAVVWKAYSIAVQVTPGDILHSSVLYLVDKSGFQRAGWAGAIEPDLLARDVRLLQSAAA
jgi:cytochrome oxidase Cu insertion factor (SCO1/SenC/PrrC family)